MVDAQLPPFPPQISFAAPSPAPQDAGYGYTSLLCTSTSDLARCMTIRFAVFVVEQQYGADVEVDEKDPACDHLLLIDPSGADVGTVRIYPALAKFGRLAVSSSARGTGAGKRMMEVLEEHVRSGKGKMGQFARSQQGLGEAERAEAWKKEGHCLVQCNSQKHAEKFYSKLGYQSEGDDFLEEGQPHVKMVKVMASTLPPLDKAPYIHLCRNQEEVDRAFDIRREVFIEEQGFALEDEIDDKDEVSDHLLLIDPTTSTNMGTIRYHPPSGKLGRLAVRKLYRGTGAGRILVDALEEHVKLRRGRGGEYAKEHGQKEVLVEASAQHQAQGFYERLGYTREGERYIEDNYPHVRMLKTVKLDDELQ